MSEVIYKDINVIGMLLLTWPTYPKWQLISIHGLAMKQGRGLVVGSIGAAPS